MFNGLRSQRLLALFTLGWLLLNVPLIALWNQPVDLAGLPLLPLALFTGWAVLIGVAAWVAEASGADDEGVDHDARTDAGPDGTHGH